MDVKQILVIASGFLLIFILLIALLIARDAKIGITIGVDQIYATKNKRFIGSNIIDIIIIIIGIIYGIMENIKAFFDSFL